MTKNRKIATRTFSEPLDSQPWLCDDNDCSQTWHKATYWIDANEDGTTTYTVDSFSDGDHTELDEDDLPAPEQIVRDWAEYRLWALKHQSDPLDEFMRGVPALDSPEADQIRKDTTE